MRSVIALAGAALFAASYAPAQTAWQLVWSDEFNGTAGSPPDPANWNYDLGAGGWGNGELETYTSSTNNAFQDGKGNLVIRVIRDANGNYTSARLQSGAPGAGTQTADGKWQYGRIEARIKLPFGQGVWPAFWMLGEDINTVGWPTSGEIDIMENFGTFNNNISTNNGTAHGPGYSGGGGLTASTTLPWGETVAQDYHIYALEWAEFAAVVCRRRFVPHGNASIAAQRHAVGIQCSILYSVERCGGRSEYFPGNAECERSVPAGHAGGLRARLPVDLRNGRDTGDHAGTHCECRIVPGHTGAGRAGSALRQQFIR